jgi:hypothetical protein
MTGDASIRRALIESKMQWLRSSATARPVVLCEGSDHPTHLDDGVSGICKVCGQLISTNADGVAYDHDREAI